jgi:hypothetical protein
MKIYGIFLDLISVSANSLASLGESHIHMCCFDLTTISYLMAASLMGFYSLPWFAKLVPVVKNTPMTQVLYVTLISK